MASLVKERFMILRRGDSFQSGIAIMDIIVLIYMMKQRTNIESFSYIDY